MMIEAKAFLHSSKESMLELGKEIGLTGAALDNFRYALYEVALNLCVDASTGEAEIVAVDGKPVCGGAEQ
jgi:hypothetical protein